MNHSFKQITFNLYENKTPGYNRDRVLQNTSSICTFRRNDMREVGKDFMELTKYKYLEEPDQSKGFTLEKYRLSKP